MADEERHGVPGAKLLTQSTAQFTSSPAQIVGGAQFDMPFSIDAPEVGCSVLHGAGGVGGCGRSR
jgi:hypothetical protein